MTRADVVTDVVTNVVTDVTDVMDVTAEVIGLVSPTRPVHKNHRADKQAVNEPTVNQIVQTTAKQDSDPETESSGEVTEPEIHMREAQVKELLLQVEVLKKRKCLELGVVMHVVLASVRMGKCVASMYFAWKG
jgi:hypothetical protein